MSTIAAQIGDLYARKLMTAQLRLDEIAKRINDMAVNVNSYADAIVTYEKWIDTLKSTVQISAIRQRYRYYSNVFLYLVRQLIRW